MNNLFGFDLGDFDRSFPGVYPVYLSKCNMPSPTPEQKAECCRIACDVCKTGNCTTGGVATCIGSCPPDLAGPVRPVNPDGPDGPVGPSPDGPYGPSPVGPSPYGPSPVGPSPDGPYGPSPVGPSPYDPSPDGPRPVVNPVVPPATPDVGLFSNLSTLQVVTLIVGLIIIIALIILIVRNMKARRSMSFY